MKKLYICFTIILLMSNTSIFSQYKKYEVKIVLDSVKSVKGTLQKVSAEGIAIEDIRGNYYIFKAKNIVKIKVRKKGLNFIESLAGGTGIGLTAGVAIFFSGDNGFNSFGENLAGTTFLTGAGAVGGALTGLVAEALNTKLILNINSDPQKYKKEYLKLEKYTKSYYLDKPNDTKK